MENSYAEIIRQLKAFARIDGLIVGALMSVCFLLMIGSLSQMAYIPFMYIMLLSVLLFVLYRTYYYKTNIVDEGVSFGRLYAYSFYCFLYGSLIFCGFILVYFLWFDNGYFSTSYITFLDNPETVATMKDLKISNNDLDQLKSLLSDLSPVDYACQFLMTNIIVSCVVSLIVALTTFFLMKKQK